MQEKETIIDKLGKYISMAGNAIMMNLLFLVSCIPVFTIGASWCGLLTAIRYYIRGEKWFTGFKTGFKTRFLRSTIAWCVMLIPNIYFLLDVRYTYASFQQVGFAHLTPFIGAVLMFVLSAMITVSLLIFNVYIPTKVGDWLRNSVNLLFKVPLELLGCAAMFWFPVVVFSVQEWQFIFVYGLMIFVALYFTLAAMGNTLLLKNALVQYLLKARADGILIAEEGKKPEAPAEEEEEYEDDETEEE